MRWLRRFLLTVSFLTILLLSVLFGTETGSRWLINSACRLSGKALAIDQIHGRLFDSLSLERVRITLPAGKILVDTADWVWQPAALFNGQIRLPYLNISGVRINLTENNKAQSKDIGKQLPSLLFPLMVIVENFVLNDLKVADANETVLYQVNSLHVRLEGFKNSILFNDFKLKMPEAAVKLHGRVEMDRDWQMDFLGNWNLEGFGFHRMDGTFSVTGPVAEPHLELGIHSPGAIRIDADFANMLDDPQWTMHLQASKVDLSQLILHCPQIVLAEVEADLEGDFSQYQGKVTALGEWDELTDMSLKSDLLGNSQGIEFNFLRIDRPPGYGQVIHGHISWADIFDWNGNFHFEDFDLSIISGKLQGIATADIVSAGKVVENGVRSTFEIIGLEGTLQDREVSIKGNVTLEESSVYTHGLTILSDGIEGVANIDSAYFSWQDEMAWRLMMRLDNFNPGIISPELVGNVSGELAGQGHFLENGPVVQMDIKSLSGKIRGKEISGEGAIHYTGDTLDSPGLTVRSGQSILTVSGKKENEFALAFTFNSPDLEDLLSEAHGAMHVTGSLSGTTQEPQLQLSLDAKDLVLRDKAIREISLELHGELKEKGKIKGRANLNGMQLGSPYDIDAEIEVEGSLQDHEINMHLGAGGTNATIVASGSYKDSWQGLLDDFVIESTEYGRWKQREAAVLAIGSRESSIANFCLSENAQEICFNGEVYINDSLTWQGELQWKSIPMADLYKAGLPFTHLAGLLEGSVAFAGKSSSLSNTEFTADLTHPIFQFDLDDGQMLVIPLDTATLEMKVSENKVESKFFLQSSDSGSLDVTIGLDGGIDLGLPLASYLNLPIRGRLAVDNFNSEIFAAYTDYLIEPKGVVKSDFTIKGTVNQPELYGDLALEKGGIAIPSQGVILEDFNISLIAKENGATVNCRAKSGPGTLVAKGHISYEKDGIEGDLRITGEEFLLVDLPEYVLRVSPDAQFHFNKDMGEIKGLIKVPYALITPEEMADSIKESSDVIFIEGEQEIKETGWPFYLNLDVLLGEEVSVEGYGLTGKLGGELKVKISSDDFITGVGELLLKDGLFTIYGRSLDIERGVVKFTGGPIDNPGIDVRAQKIVSDRDAKGEGYTVGVDISGLTQDLKYQLFSDPYKEETEILSLLIVGHSLTGSSDAEGNLLLSAAESLGIAGSGTILKGLGEFLSVDDLHMEGSEKDEDVSLVMGKNLTKDLYLGYDINLFNEIGQFRVRYDLAHGFWVETKSSSESTSADLLYTFER